MVKTIIKGKRARISKEIDRILLEMIYLKGT